MTREAARPVPIHHIEAYGVLTRTENSFTTFDSGTDLIVLRRRSSRVRKEMGTIGQASWASSVINLLNTSMLYTG